GTPMAIVASRKRRRHKKHRPRHHQAAHPKPKPKPKPKPTPAKKPTAVATQVVPLALATSRERLFLNRFGSGFPQGALTRMRAYGGPEAWLAAQLQPSSVTESSKVAQVNSWFAPLATS